MSELREKLKKEFVDLEYREAYAEDFLNTSIATQIRVIREQRPMTQGELAEKVGTKQAGISRIENVNYSTWKIETLRKIAFALGCRLKVSIETFGSLLEEAEAFSRESLKRISFEEDPAFKVQSETMQVTTDETIWASAWLPLEAGVMKSSKKFMVGITGNAINKTVEIAE